MGGNNVDVSSFSEDSASPHVSSRLLESSSISASDATVSTVDLLDIFPVFLGNSQAAAVEDGASMLEVPVLDIRDKLDRN